MRGCVCGRFLIYKPMHMYTHVHTPATHVFGGRCFLPRWCLGPQCDSPATAIVDVQVRRCLTHAPPTLLITTT